MRVIHTDKAPRAIGPYSQAIIHGDLVFCSGQIPVSPETGEVVGGDITAQAGRACENLGEVLKAAGSGFEKVLKTTCFLSDMADFAAFNAVYERFFTGRPARSCFAVRELPKGVLVELEAIAIIG